MGSIDDVAKGFDGPGWSDALQRHSVEWLGQLAKTQTRLLDLEIQNAIVAERDNRTSPATSILSVLHETRAYQPSDETKIRAQVDTAVNGLVQHAPPGVTNAMSNVVSEILRTFLGTNETDSDVVNTTFVMSDGDSLVRIDLAGWFMMIGDDAIRAKMQRVTAFAAVKAAIDLQRLDFTAFRITYTLQLRNGGMTDEQIVQAVEHAHQIYERGSEQHNP